MKTIHFSLAFLFFLTLDVFAQSILNDCPERATVAGLNDCCGNFGDDLPVDTLRGPWPALLFETYRGDLSPDGRYLACNLRLGKPYFNGYCIVDISTYRIIDYHNSAWIPRWSHNGKRVVNNAYIFDFEYSTIIPFPIFPDGVVYKSPEWSVDGKHIYYNTNFGSFRSDANGDSLIFVGSKSRSIPMTTDTLLYIKRYQDDLSTPGYELFYIPSRTSYFIPVAEWDSIHAFWE